MSVQVQQGLAASGGGLQLLDTVAATSGTTVTNSVAIPSTARRLYVEFDNFSFTGNTTLQISASTDGLTFGAAVTLFTTLSASLEFISFEINGLQQAYNSFVVRDISRATTSTTAATDEAAVVGNRNAAAAITHIRLSGGTFDGAGGSVRFYYQ